jgi:hypothetical protein
MGDWLPTEDDWVEHHIVMCSATGRDIEVELSDDEREESLHDDRTRLGYILASDDPQFGEEGVDS